MKTWHLLSCFSELITNNWMELLPSCKNEFYSHVIVVIRIALIVLNRIRE